MQGSQHAMLVHLVMVVSTVMSTPPLPPSAPERRPVRCGNSKLDYCTETAVGDRNPAELHEVRVCPRTLPLACTVLTAPLFAARCAVAQMSSYQIGSSLGMTALCGASRMRAGCAHETRPSPRPRPSAKTQTRGSAPSPSSRAAAPQELGVSSTMSSCGESLRRRRRSRRQNHP